MLVLVVLVLLLALPGAEGKSRSSAKRRKRRSRTWKARLRECDEGVCAHLIKDENANCVNRCASAACFNQIYAAEPLEDGPDGCMNPPPAGPGPAVFEEKQRGWRPRGCSWSLLT